MEIREICGTTPIKKHAEESPTDVADLHGGGVRNYSPTDVTDFHGCGCVRKNTNHTNAAQEKICENPWNLWDNILKQNTWESVESAGVYNN